MLINAEKRCEVLCLILHDPSIDNCTLISTPMISILALLCKLTADHDFLPTYECQLIYKYKCIQHLLEHVCTAHDQCFFVATTAAPVGMLSFELLGLPKFSCSQGINGE